MSERFILRVPREVVKNRSKVGPTDGLSWLKQVFSSNATCVAAFAAAVDAAAARLDRRRAAGPGTRRARGNTLTRAGAVCAAHLFRVGTPTRSVPVYEKGRMLKCMRVARSSSFRPLGLGSLLGRVLWCLAQPNPRDCVCRVSCLWSTTRRCQSREPNPASLSIPPGCCSASHNPRDCVCRVSCLGGLRRSYNRVAPVTPQLRALVTLNVQPTYM